MSDTSRHVPLGEGREFDVIRSLLEEWGSVARGIGDDAAVLAPPAGELLVASTDASVEGVHFRREWLSAEEIGYRAATAALSDLAAMAATPAGLLVALAAPPAWDDLLRELARGLGRAAHAARCPIIGGNVTRASELSITSTVLGLARDPIGRGGARPGDLVLVTGRLGGPAQALAAWLRGQQPESADRERFAAPSARLEEARWLAAGGARAIIDISDGLAADAAHLAVASGVTLALDAGDVPCMPGAIMAQAIESGEEYELLVAVPPGSGLDGREFERRVGIPVTRIGVVVAPVPGTALQWRDGRVDSPRGHDHFS